MGTVIASCVLFLIAAAAFVLSIRAFRQKGFLLNNAYLYASPKERQTMDKKPYYRQTAVVFLLVGLIFSLNGLSVLLEMKEISYPATAVTVAAVVYAVASTVAVGVASAMAAALA